MVKKRDPESVPVGEVQRALLKRLDEMGVDMRTASVDWLDRNPAYIQQFIFRGSPQVLAEADRRKLAARTGLTEDQLGRPDPDAGMSDGQSPFQPKGVRTKIVPYDGPSLNRGGPTIPIYAAAKGGDGHLIITFDPIEHMGPPEDLMRVRNAYGILVVGESMVPAFRPGDIAWVNPNRPPERDIEAVFYHVPPHGEAEAMIKTLVSFSPTEWKLRQYQPPKEWSESRLDWPVCHRIIGKKSAR